MSSKNEEAKDIIHLAATKCAGIAGALAQGAVVGADAPLLTAVQTEMVNNLAKLFAHDLDMADLVAYLGTQAGVTIGVVGARAVLGWFPGIGNLANAAVTFSHTEALGWAAYKYFESK